MIITEERSKSSWSSRKPLPGSVWDLHSMRWNLPRILEIWTLYTSVHSKLWTCEEPCQTNIWAYKKMWMAASCTYNIERSTVHTTAVTAQHTTHHKSCLLLGQHPVIQSVPECKFSKKNSIKSMHAGTWHKNTYMQEEQPVSISSATTTHLTKKLTALYSSKKFVVDNRS